MAEAPEDFRKPTTLVAGMLLCATEVLRAQAKACVGLNDCRLVVDAS